MATLGLPTCPPTLSISKAFRTPLTHFHTINSAHRIRRLRCPHPGHKTSQQLPSRCRCSNSNSRTSGSNDNDSDSSKRKQGPLESSSRQTRDPALTAGPETVAAGEVPTSPSREPLRLNEIATDPDPDGDLYRSGQLPSAMDGLNWWCYTVLGLLFITDFTPLGRFLLAGSSDAGLYLCAVQWGLFVLPTLNYCRERRWDILHVLRLRSCASSWLVAGLMLGPLLWVATAAAIAARTGVDISQLAGSASADSPVAGLLFGELLKHPYDAGQWLRTLGTSVLSPAVAEELLYRGFLLTALRQRFGTVDAAALAAAMFAAAHLSIPQFFAFTLLGGACGGLTLGSGSVLPAVVAHAAYNAVGIVVGVATVMVGAGGGPGAG